MHGNLSAILARHQHDPLRLVQILRDVMAVEGYLSARRHHVPRRGAEASARAGRGCGRVLLVLRERATRTLSRPLQRQRHRRDGRQRRAPRAHARRVPDRARRGEPRRPGQRGASPRAPGLCDQGPAMLVNGHAIARLTHARIGAICSLIRGGSPVDAVARELVRDRVAPRAEGSAALHAAARRARRSTPRWRAARRARSPRSRRRGSAAAAAPAFRPGRSGRRAPARRGPSASSSATPTRASPAPSRIASSWPHHADLVLDGMTVAAFAVGAQKGFLYLRGEYPFLIAPLEAALARPARARTSSARRSAASRLRLRHRAPRRRGRLRVRRGIGAHRVARGQARHPAQPAPLPRHARVPAEAHGGEQRGDARVRRAHRDARRDVVPRGGHREVDGHEGALRLRRRARARGSTSTRSA